MMVRIDSSISDFSPQKSQSPNRQANGSATLRNQYTRISVEKAVKKLEFGRINTRTNEYMKDQYALSPNKREESIMNRMNALSKMSLRRNDSDFSQALVNQGISAWKDKATPMIQTGTKVINVGTINELSPLRQKLRPGQNSTKMSQKNLVAHLGQRLRNSYDSTYHVDTNWQWQMNATEACDKLEAIYGELEQHQTEFKDKTRIDSVDVIIRRKDKKLEPIEPQPLNVAQQRVNSKGKTTAQNFKTLSKEHMRKIKDEIYVQQSLMVNQNKTESESRYEQNLKYLAAVEMQQQKDSSLLEKPMTKPLGGKNLSQLVLNKKTSQPTVVPPIDLNRVALGHNRSQAILKLEASSTNQGLHLNSDSFTQRAMKDSTRFDKSERQVIEKTGKDQFDYASPKNIYADDQSPMTNHQIILASSPKEESKMQTTSFNGASKVSVERKENNLRFVIN